MGAEYKLMFERGEAKKVRDWLARLPKTGGLGIEFDVGRNEPLNVNVWFTFPKKSSVLEIGYSFGYGQLTGELAIAVGQELAKRVKIKKWGWDSVGWTTAEDRAKWGFPRAFVGQMEMDDEFRKQHPIVAGAMEYLTKRTEQLKKDQEQMETTVGKLFDETWPL